VTCCTHHSSRGIGLGRVCIRIDLYILGFGARSVAARTRVPRCDLLDRLRIMLPKLRRFLSSMSAVA
jgi:hypothetical protein